MRDSSMVILCFLVTASACSVDAGDGHSSPSGGDDDDDGSNSTCSCSVDNNGESETIACGDEACVAGTSFHCDESAKITEAGSACASTHDPEKKDAGKKDAGKKDAAPTASTVPCEYHDFDANKDVTSCDAKTEYCIRSYTSSLGPGSNNFCAPFPSGCSTCSCASANADAAWRAAFHNTINCTNATIACEDSNGAVIVDCVK